MLQDSILQVTEQFHRIAGKEENENPCWESVEAADERPNWLRCDPSGTLSCETLYRPIHVVSCSFRRAASLPLKFPASAYGQRYETTRRGWGVYS